MEECTNEITMNIWWYCVLVHLTNELEKVGEWSLYHNTQKGTVDITIFRQILNLDDNDKQNLQFHSERL